jgi:uncharacterized protein YbbC (DUF1343 family)
MTSPRLRRCLTFLVVLLAMARTSESTAMSPESRIDRQIAQLVAALQGKRVGLLTNPTGVDARYNLIADRLHADPEVQLVAFFAPEHGLRGDRQAGGSVQDYVDPITGLPVYSLYGARREPTADQLATLDVIVFDIQDVGARFYTYVWTMSHVMEACAAAGKEFVVFDRPNPVGLQRVEGAPNTFDAGLIGRLWTGQPFGLATRHGMTAGEVATLVNSEWMQPKVGLTVIPVPDYHRGMTFEQTGYPWVMPSPNMPTRETASVYPGMCIFEGSNMSEGRGTTRPFELVGAPFIDGTVLARELNALDLPGVRFRAAWFIPSFDDFSGQSCGGIQVHVTDPAQFDPIRTGMHVLKMSITLYPQQTTITDWAGRLMGVPNLHNRLKTESVEAIIAGWQENLESFRVVRARNLLYPEAPAGSSSWKID